MKIIKKHLISYRYAVRGVWLAFKLEPNMKVHSAAAAGVVTLNFLLQITQTDWLIIIVLIGINLMAEIFNTTIEQLADRVTSDHDSLIGKAKDLSSGAVLVISATSVVCAFIIYLPYL